MKASWTVACGVPPWMLSPPGRLTKAQRELAVQLGTDPDRPWHRFDPDSAEGRLCGEVARRLRRPSLPAYLIPALAADFGRTP